MRSIFLIIFFSFMLYNGANAQKKWDLLQIVEYARANNIPVKQAEVQAALSGLVYDQSKMALFPNLSFGGNTSFNSGRNQDPTSFSLITQSYLNAGLQLQSSVDIFNWFSKRNQILANQWEFQAAKASAEKVRNDVALNVANNYLQILLAKEQEKIAKVQLEQTKAQLAYTQKLVDAGSLPELNAAELQAQEARDSANYVSAKGAVIQNILVLKSNMNIEADAPFEVVVPPIESIPVENIADLQPAAVYELAIKNLPQQRLNEFRLQAAKKRSDVARGNMYPSVSAFGGLSSNFINRKQPISAPTGTYSSNILSPQVDIGGTIYKVNTPNYTIIGEQGTPFFRQMENNFRQQVGLSINVPIFNGAQLKTNFRRTQYEIRNAELQMKAENQQIKQDIYQAYNAATVALEKFNASEKSVAASQRTYDFAQKRYEVGMLSTFELITNQNNLFRAKLENVLNQFDLVFKMKVLEFYKGQGLKL